MSKTISISIPYTLVALQAAATMFNEMAAELGDVEPAAQPTHPDPAVTNVVTQVKETPKAEEVFATGATVNKAENETVLPANVISFDQAMVGPDTTVAAVIDPATMVTEEVELDSAGLPWDGRIHASTKTKDAKGKWKLLRGIDRATFLPKIEAELRAAIAGEPEEPAQPSAAVTTFAQLVTTVTAQGVPDEKINAALAAVGVQNFALLGAKPELVPVVAGHLGL